LRGGILSELHDRPCIVPASGKCRDLTAPA
jgi:hypothetical protein